MTGLEAGLNSVRVLAWHTEEARTRFEMALDIIVAQDDYEDDCNNPWCY